MAQTPHKFYFDNSNSPFKDFPEEEILRLTKAYQTPEPIKNIVKDIDGITASNFYRYLPYLLSNEKCNKCEHPVYTKMPTRTYNEDEEKKICLNCNHNFTKGCICEHCVKERQEAFKRNEAEYIKQAQEWLKQEETPYYAPEEVSLLEEIKIRSLTYYFTDKKYAINLNELQKQPDELPSKIRAEHFDYILQLSAKGLLIPAGYLEYHEGLSKNENGKYEFSRGPFDTLWQVNVWGNITTAEYVDNLLDKEYSTDEKLLLWKEVYQSELKQYLDYQNKCYVQNLLDTNLLDVYLDDLIEHFSLAKAYALIYFTTSGCMRYIQGFNPNKKALKTRFLNLLEKNITKYKNNPNLKDFNRLDFRRSKVNRFIVKNLLNQEKNYFYLPTNKIFKTVKL